MIKILLIVVACLAVLVAIPWVIGSLLPVAHTASRTIRLHQPPEAVWQAITDHQTMPSWRSDLARVERLPDEDGHEVWQEVYKNGWKLPMMTAVSEPPRKLASKIMDPKKNFGGTWTFDVQPRNGGSQLTITENGEVYNPIFRLFSKLGDQRKTMTVYETDLARKFGESPDFEN